MKKKPKQSDHYNERMAEINKDWEELSKWALLLERVLRGDLQNDYNDYLIELEEILFDNNIPTDVWES